MEELTRVEQKKIKKTVRLINDTLVSKVGEAMIIIGDHLIDEYFNGDLSLVRKTSPTKQMSLRILQGVVEEELGVGRGTLHNAITIAAFKREHPEMGVFWELGHSHRLALLPLRRDIEAMKSVAKECKEKNIPVRKLREKVSDEISRLPRDPRGRPKKTPQQRLLDSFKEFYSTVKSKDVLRSKRSDQEATKTRNEIDKLIKRLQFIRERI